MKFNVKLSSLLEAHQVNREILRKFVWFFDENIRLGIKKKCHAIPGQLNCDPTIWPKAHPIYFTMFPALPSSHTSGLLGPGNVSGNMYYVRVAIL